MLTFLYTGKYNSSIDGVQQALVDAHVYALGDKYGIERLKEQAQKNFQNSRTRLPSDEIPKLLEIIYTTTPSMDRGLRNNVEPLLVKCKVELRAHEYFMELFKTKLDFDFAVDVLDAFSSLSPPNTPSVTPSVARNLRCSHCKTDTAIAWCNPCATHRPIRNQGRVKYCSVCGGSEFADPGIFCNTCLLPVFQEP